MYGYWIRQEETVIASVFAYYRLYSTKSAPLRKAAHKGVRIQEQVQLSKAQVLTCGDGKSKQHTAAPPSVWAAPRGIDPATIIVAARVEHARAAVGVRD